VSLHQFSLTQFIKKKLTIVLGSVNRIRTCVHDR
jgi:hypothetical protein